MTTENLVDTLSAALEKAEKERDALREALELAYDWQTQKTKASTEAT
jgi:hypothetical protein